ncbi:hypothetical protein CAPTEDRAFT_91257, partial [Capitella teleta]
GNYRSGLHDCVFARKFKPNHAKAIIRGMHCLMGMRRYADAILWCDSALLLDPESVEVLEIRKKAETKQDRGIRLDNKLELDEDDDDDVEILPEMEKVQVDDGGTMFWPVMFLYPEHAQSDHIEAFSENSTFNDHINVMFDPINEVIPWDLHGTYKKGNLKVYFEDRDKEVLYEIPLNKTLLQALQHKRYVRLYLFQSISF